MKMMSKTIAVAALAVAATGVAEARIALGTDTTAAGGEFALAITNLTKEVSYVLDSGIFSVNLNPNAPLTLTTTAAADAAFSQFISSYTAGDNVVWGFGTANVLLEATEQVPNVGYYGTKETPANPNLSGYLQANTAWSTMMNLNNTGTVGIDDAVNTSSFRAKGTAGYLGDYGLNGGGAAAYNIFGGLGNSLAFIKDGVTGEFGDIPTFQLLGTANLALTSNSATFTAFSAPAAVPLPAAVWMFGAGLMGMLRLNRRKSVTA
ncbi:MAG: hypothetical protein HOP23_11220 [Methylococcaceae bacterium]|nr:hypothetical protein [Methylococcaceae bacterium]